jgi:hypothetical protein
MCLLSVSVQLEDLQALDGISCLYSPTHESIQLIHLISCEINMFTPVSKSYRTFMKKILQL